MCSQVMFTVIIIIFPADLKVYHRAQDVKEATF